MDRLPETTGCDKEADRCGHDKSSFGYNITAPQQQSGSYLVPVYSSPPPMSLHHDLGPASWPMPFHQPNGYVYHGGPVAYGPSDFFVQYGVAAPVFNLYHHPSTANGGVDVRTSSNEPRNTIPSPNPAPRKHEGLGAAPVAGQNAAALNDAKASDGGGDPSFSLFHFGGPVASGCAKLPQVPCSRDEMEMKEYGLFSPGNAAMFSFL